MAALKADGSRLLPHHQKNRWLKTAVQRSCTKTAALRNDRKTNSLKFLAITDLRQPCWQADRPKSKR